MNSCHFFQHNLHRVHEKDSDYEYNLVLKINGKDGDEGAKVDALEAVVFDKVLEDNAHCKKCRYEEHHY